MSISNLVGYIRRSLLKTRFKYCHAKYRLRQTLKEGCKFYQSNPNLTKEAIIKFNKYFLPHRDLNHKPTAPKADTLPSDISRLDTLLLFII